MTAWWKTVAGLDQRLTALHAEKLSMRQIADTLNREFNVDLTRNSCVGRSHRLGLVQRNQAEAYRTHVKTKRVSPAVRSAIAKEASKPQKPLRPPVVVCDPVEPVRLIDLRDEHCRYPVTAAPGAKYCGRHRLGGSSYCREHHVFIHQPLTARSAANVRSRVR